MLWLYILLIVLGLFTLLLLLRLRLRVYIDDGRRLISFSYATARIEANIRENEGTASFLGITLRRFPLVKDESEKKKKQGKKEEAEQENGPGPLRKLARSFREKKGRLTVIDLLAVAPQITWAHARLFADIFGDTTVEQLDVDIEGGFEYPHLTGQMLGYYHALVGAVPMGPVRISYVPDWDGAPFTGSVRASLALPLYRLLYRLLRYLFRLPIMNIVKRMRRNRKGESNAGEQ